MVMMIRDMEIREEGREEGRAEGREEGRVEGRVEGREEGIFLTLSDLVKSGLLSVAEAAKRAKMSIPDFQSRMNSL